MRPGDNKRFYLHDESVMSRWNDDDRIIAVKPMIICFSWEKQVSVAPKVYRPFIFSFPTPTPLRLPLINSPAVFVACKNSRFSSLFAAEDRFVKRR